MEPFIKRFYTASSHFISIRTKYFHHVIPKHTQSLFCHQNEELRR